MVLGSERPSHSGWHSDDHGCAMPSSAAAGHRGSESLSSGPRRPAHPQQLFGKSPLEAAVSHHVDQPRVGADNELPAPVGEHATTGTTGATASSQQAAALLSICSARLVASNERVHDLEAQLQELTRVAALAIKAQRDAEIQLADVHRHDDAIHDHDGHDGDHDGHDGDHDGRLGGAIGSGCSRADLSSRCSAMNEVTVTRTTPSQTSASAAVSAFAATAVAAQAHHDMALAALTIERDSAVAALKEMCMALTRAPSRSRAPSPGHSLADSELGSRPEGKRRQSRAADATDRVKASKGNSSLHDHHDDLSSGGSRVKDGWTDAPLSRRSSAAGRRDDALDPEALLAGAKGVVAATLVSGHYDGSPAATTPSQLAEDRVQRIRLIVAAQLAARAHKAGEFQIGARLTA